MPKVLTPEQKAARKKAIFELLPATQAVVAKELSLLNSTVSSEFKRLKEAGEVYQSAWEPLHSAHGMVVRYLAVYSAGTAPRGFVLPGKPKFAGTKEAQRLRGERVRRALAFYDKMQEGKEPVPTFTEMLESNKRADENRMMGATGGESYWRYGISAPLGEKLLLLTVGGVAVIGNWQGMMGDMYLAWSYLPKRDKEAEKAIINNPNLKDYD